LQQLARKASLQLNGEHPSQGQLQELTPEEKKKAHQGELRIAFSLPRHAVSLIQINW
jgi:hypothetical protein